MTKIEKIIFGVPANKAWRILFAIFRFGLAMGILWALVHFEIINIWVLSRLWTNPVGLVGAVLCLLVATLVAAQRWRLLLEIQGVKVRYGAVCRLFGLACLAGTVLPGATSGEALKMLWVMRCIPNARLSAALSIVMDKIIGFFAVVVTGAAASLLNLDEVSANPALRVFVLSLWLLIGGVLVGGLGLILLRRWQIGTRVLGDNQGWLSRLLRQGIDVVRAYLDVPGTLARAFLLSLLCSMLMVASIILLARSMDAGALMPSQYAVAMVAGLLANLLPLTPGGIGVGESGFGYICHLLDAGSGVAYGSAFLAFRLASILALLPFLLAMSHAELVIVDKTN
jgi:uncharacterized membrane protein YbhN (UPF0104 family)